MCSLLCIPAILPDRDMLYGGITKAAVCCYCTYMAHIISNCILWQRGVIEHYTESCQSDIKFEQLLKQHSETCHIPLDLIRQTNPCGFDDVAIIINYHHVYCYFRARKALMMPNVLLRTIAIVPFWFSIKHCKNSPSQGFWF